VRDATKRVANRDPAAQLPTLVRSLSASAELDPTVGRVDWVAAHVVTAGRWFASGRRMGIARLVVELQHPPDCRGWDNQPAPNAEYGDFTSGGGCVCSGPAESERSPGHRPQGDGRSLSCGWEGSGGCAVLHRAVGAHVVQPRIHSHLWQ